jgi:hypothetical protein
LIVILILLATCFLVYSPHLEYKYPLHYDEWRHLDNAIKSIKRTRLIDHPWGAETEGGFYMWLIPTMIITNMDPLLDYKFLPCINMAIAAFILYVFLRRTTGSFATAVFGMLFFASLRSNLNVMGPWVFVPMSMAFPLIFMFFSCLVRGTRLGYEKYFVMAFIFLLVLVTVHVLSALFTIPILLIYFAINYRFLMKRWYLILPTILIPLLGLSFTLQVFPEKGLVGVLQSLMEGFGIFYPPAWSGLMPHYRILLFYGQLAFLFAAIGLIVAFRKHIIFVIWALVTGIWFYANMLWLKQDFLVPYLRLLYPLLFGLIPLSAIGLNWCVDFIEKKIKFSRLLKIILTVALILTVIITTFDSYYTAPINMDFFRYINDEDIDALKLAESDVLSDIRLGRPALPFFSFGIKVKQIDLLKGTDYDFDFEDLDCDKKEEYMLQYKTEYLLTDTEQKCRFDLVFEGDFRYLYRLAPPQ